MGGFLLGSTIIDVVEFLVSRQLPLQGKLDVFSDMSEGESRLFLSLFDLRKFPKCHIHNSGDAK